MTEGDSPIEQLGRALTAVDGLIRAVRPEQWSAPTPCAQWTAAQLVNHLVGMNRVFVAMLSNEPPPQRSERSSGELADAFATSSAGLLAAFSRPGVLEQEFTGPLGMVTGAGRLQIRLYDLIAHGWDLARATGQDARLLPDDLAEQSLTFVRGQLSGQARPGRFDLAQPVADDAPAIDRLAAFLGRRVSWG